MYLKQARPPAQRRMTLLFAGMAYRISQPGALALLAFLGLMRVQESVNNWCPSALFFWPMGLKQKRKTTPST